MTQQKFFSYFLLAVATFIFFYVVWNEVLSVWTGTLTQHQIVSILLVSIFVIYVWYRVLNQLKQIKKKSDNSAV
jgi:membrane protein implicated in regulation of membrane protease activity